MRAVLSSAKQLLVPVRAVAQLVSDAWLFSTPDGLYVEAIDSSGAMLIQMSLQRELFCAYEHEDANPIFVRFKELRRILSQHGQNSSLEIHFTGTSLLMTFKCSSGLETQFCLECPPQGKPERMLTTTDRSPSICISAADFKRIAEEANHTSTSVSIQSDIKAITFEAGIFTAMLPTDSEEKARINVSANFLHQISKITISTTANIHLQNDGPLLVCYNSFGVSLYIWLAPLLKK